MINTVPNTLPDTLSALIRVALVDLRKCEKDDKYVINMDDWRFGRSVMVKTLNLTSTTHIVPSAFRDYSTFNKIRALNWAKSGVVSEALRYIPICMSISYTEKYDRHIVRYADDPELFHKQMSQLADDLEADGL